MSPFNQIIEIILLAHNFEPMNRGTKHVMALVVDRPVLLFDVELAEEVEGYHCVDIDHHTGQHHCQHQL